MKLYFSPGACSLSSHIVLRELGYEFELDQVNLGTKQTKSGADYRAVNPKGYVPALSLEDGQALTEGVAIVQYLADKRPEKGLAPAPGTLERVRLQEWLNFIATEVHKGMSPLFNPKAPEEWKAIVRENVSKRLDFVAQQLKSSDYLLGDKFTVPDAYLFTVLRWTNNLGINIDKWPVLQAYVSRVSARPAVHAALQAEGLLKQ